MVQLKHLPNPQLVFVADPDTCATIGGVLVRSGLAYLDRNQVLADLRPPLDRVSSSSDLYRRFLTIVVVDTMAVDRFRVSQGFRRALRQVGSAVCRPAALASLAPINSLIFRFSPACPTWLARALPVAWSPDPWPAKAGPSAGFQPLAPLYPRPRVVDGGHGAGVDRMMELTISVGAGVAITAALAEQQLTTMVQIVPVDVAQLLVRCGLIVGRPSFETSWQRLYRLIE